MSRAPLSGRSPDAPFWARLPYALPRLRAVPGASPAPLRARSTGASSGRVSRARLPSASPGRASLPGASLGAPSGRASRARLALKLLSKRAPGALSSGYGMLRARLPGASPGRASVPGASPGAPSGRARHGAPPARASPSSRARFTSPSNSRARLRARPGRALRLRACPGASPGRASLFAGHASSSFRIVLKLGGHGRALLSDAPFRARPCARLRGAPCILTRFPGAFFSRWARSRAGVLPGALPGRVRRATSAVILERFWLLGDARRTPGYVRVRARLPGASPGRVSRARLLVCRARLAFKPARFAMFRLIL